jgi:two-component system OmpR family response regulator
LPEVVVLDDDLAMHSLLARILGAEYALTFVNTSKALLSRLASHHVDLVLLDIVLPQENGIDICRSIRSESLVPIVLISGLVSEEMIARGLDVGALDYVTKPFSPMVLKARIRNALRVRYPEAHSPAGARQRIGRVVVDPLERTASSAAGDHVDLTEKELQLILLLSRAAGNVVERNTLSLALSGFEWSPLNRSLDVHVSNLRRKLMSIGCKGSVIASFRGVGYALQAAVVFVAEDGSA